MADTSGTSPSGSPWEEVLEEEVDNKPKVFGSLNNAGTPTEAPHQLKVPETIPQGVGSKIPAEQALKNQQNQAAPVPAPTVKPATSLNQPAPVAPPASPSQPPASTQKGVFGKIFQRSPRQAISASNQAPATLPPTQSPVPVNPVTPVAAPAQPSMQRPAGKTVVPSQTTALPQNMPNGQARNQVPGPLGSVKNIITRPKFLIVEILVVLLVGLVYLNETGILPTGLEKVYGVFHLEALWGGLPADPQLALGESFKKMQLQQSMTLNSDIKFTVNKNIDSKLTKPLFAVKDPIFLFALDKAIRAVATDQTSQDTIDYTTSLDTTISDQTNQTESPTVTPVPDTATTSTTEQTSQNPTSESTATTTVKEFSATEKTQLSTNGASSDIVITTESTKQLDVNLVSQNSKLFVKSTGVDFSGSSKGWVYEDLGLSKEVYSSIFSSPNLSGFSVTGSRLGSGRVNGYAVYRYKVNIKIGSLLSEIGVEDSAVNSITGEVDIGKKDHLIRGVNISIIPSASSSITRFDINSLITGYGAASDISTPLDAVAINATSTNSSAKTTPTIQQNSKYSAELLARDAQRKTDLNAISSALTQYYTATGGYPSTNDEIIQTRAAGNVLSTTLVPTYLNSLPVDPMTDKYYYGYKSNGSSYELSAVLGNMEDPDGTLLAGKNLYIIKN